MKPDRNSIGARRTNWRNSLCGKKYRNRNCDKRTVLDDVLYNRLLGMAETMEQDQP